MMFIKAISYAALVTTGTATLETDYLKISQSGLLSVRPGWIILPDCKKIYYP